MKAVKILTTIAVIAMSSFAFADETTPPPVAHHTKGAMFDHILQPKTVESLTLTADQQTALASLDAAFKKDAAKWRAENPVDEAAVQKARETQDGEAIRQLRQKQQGLMDIRKSYIEKFRASLTAEQQAAFDKAISAGRKNPAQQKPTPVTPPAN